MNIQDFEKSKFMAKVKAGKAEIQKKIGPLKKKQMNDLLDSLVALIKQDLKLEIPEQDNGSNGETDGDGGNATEQSEVSTAVTDGNKNVGDDEAILRRLDNLEEKLYKVTRYLKFKTDFRLDHQTRNKRDNSPKESKENRNDTRKPNPTKRGTANGNDQWIKKGNFRERRTSYVRKRDYSPQYRPNQDHNCYAPPANQQYPMNHWVQGMAGHFNHPNRFQPLMNQNQGMY